MFFHTPLLTAEFEACLNAIPKKGQTWSVNRVANHGDPFGTPNHIFVRVITIIPRVTRTKMERQVPQHMLLRPAVVQTITRLYRSFCQFVMAWPVTQVSHLELTVLFRGEPPIAVDHHRLHSGQTTNKTSSPPQMHWNTHTWTCACSNPENVWSIEWRYWRFELNPNKKSKKI